MMLHHQDPDDETERWLAIRREAALKINASTAYVRFAWGPVLDPYRVHDLPPEAMCIGRVYFARGPVSDIWVSFDDLPADTAKGLWRRMRGGDTATCTDDDCRMKANTAGVVHRMSQGSRDK
jgi:hypothetical protein